MYFICLSGGVGFDECRPQGLAQSTKMSWRQFCAFLTAAAAYSIMATEGNTTDIERYGKTNIPLGSSKVELPCRSKW